VDGRFGVESLRPIQMPAARKGKTVREVRRRNRLWQNAIVRN
jgi:hypothetical protein